VLQHERFNRQTQQTDKLQFASKSEMATGLLLERYIPGFELIPGKTFQVPIGLGKHCDFKVGNIFLEYHPVNLHFEFYDKQALRQFRTAMRHVPKNAKRQIVEALKDELGERYYRNRKQVVDMWITSQNEFVVVQDPVELYRQVIKPHGRDVPKEHKFLAEFDKLRS
jgi:hypothetical protein